MGLWRFQAVGYTKEEEYAKKFRLCFRSLGEDHLGQHCSRTRVCGQNGCKEVHHRLLHKDSLLPSNDTKANKNEENNKCEKNEKVTSGERVESPKAESPAEGEQKQNEQRARQPDTTMMTETTGNIALRTVPVYIKSGNQKMQVNALLDDASTKPI